MTTHNRSERARYLGGLAPVIPVLVIPDASVAADLGRALIDGGLPVLEITLRSDAALDAIRAMADLPGGHVGAGTVLTADDARRAKDHGATFAVSPGLTEALAKACDDLALPLLPGVSTASEAMAAMELGFDMLKLFPAEAVGGRALLKALGGPLPQITFCPTGGITQATAPDYLALPNVTCVGGSWIAPEADQRARDWNAIGERARAAAALRG